MNTTISKHTKEHEPFAPAVAHLLSKCRGEGAVVAVMPEAMPNEAPPHHFYAGIARPPALSFLEALLLALGGDLPEGGRRYEEIVVTTASAKFDEEGRDKPPEEAVQLRDGESLIAMGNDWLTWWYRRPSDRSTPEGGAELGGGRPSPRRGRRRDYGEIENTRAPRNAREFPSQLTLTEQAEKITDRHQELRQILETLERRPHRTLLLVELAVLDFAHPGSVDPHELSRLSDEGLKRMAWLPEWVNQRPDTASRFDVVLYSRNRRRVEAFLGQGLPRRAAEFLGPWPVSMYKGRNLPVLEWPCGEHIWGRQIFSDPNSVAFRAADGTQNDTPEGQQGYSNRTLRALLRGQSPDGGTIRVQMTRAHPLAPRRPPEGDLISREFWSALDVHAVREYVLSRYFGAKQNGPLLELFKTIEKMQATAREIKSPKQFHDAVKERWQKVSSQMLWGIGGMGKSYLGELLSEAIFGHKPLVIEGQQAGGGSSLDPIANFRSVVFGAPAGYQDSGQLSSVGSHFNSTRGFTVLVIDEVQAIAEDFFKAFQALFGLLEKREYMPQNPILTQHRSIKLWNTIFVLTANLSTFPPPGVPPASVKAIQRRVSDYEFKEMALDEVRRFVQWYLPKAAEGEMGGASIFSCDDLTEEIAALQLPHRTLDQVRSDLVDEVARIKDELQRDGLTPSTCPLVLDITDYVRRALV